MALRPKPSGGSGGASAWGDITGLIGNQHDLANALGAKLGMTAQAADSAKLANETPTTVGLSLVALPDAGAVRYIRINANNTIDELSASDLVTALSINNGPIWYGGDGVPSDAVGVHNDRYTNLLNGDVYTKGTITWGSASDTMTTPNQIKHGFENQTDSTIGLVDGTRVFTLGVTSGSYNYWFAGAKVNVTGSKNVTISNTVGLHYIYLASNGTLAETMTPINYASISVVAVANIYWNGANGALQDERHGANRPLVWHSWAHATIGTRYQSGLTGTFTATTLSIVSGIICDEDIIFSITGPVTICRLWRLDSGSGLMTFASSTTPYASSGGVLQYDNAGTLTNVTAGRYVVNDVYGALDIGDPVYVRVSTAQYTSLVNAQAAPINAFANVVSPELKLLYRVIYQYSGGNILINSAVDYRTSGTLPGGGFAQNTALSTSYNPSTPLVSGNVQGALDQVAGNLATIGTIAGSRSTFVASAGTAGGSVAAADHTHPVNNPATTPQGVYNPSTAYTVGQSVSYNGIMYVCIQAGTGQQPDTTPLYWQAITTPGIAYGSFVPSFTGLTTVPGTGTITYAGGWTRIGPIVFWWAQVISTGNATTSSISSTTYINNLPFVSINQSGNFASQSGISFAAGWTVAGTTNAFMPAWTTKTGIIYISGIIFII